MLLQPPYAADTRAKGWRFELDLERIQQSDTWALADAEARPWLLMIWCTAWQQVPCGSLPADERILCARIGAPTKVWVKHREVLLRGWEPASDGRLYHSVIVAQVRAMLERKDAERARKAEYRARMDAERAQKSARVPRDKRGTDKGRTRESGGKDATGTGTGTGTSSNTNTPPTPPPAADLPGSPALDRGQSAPTQPDGEDPGAPAAAATPPPGVPTPAGAVCLALRQAGIADVNPAHPLLLALLEAGATTAEFVAAAGAAAGKARGFAYTLAVVEGQRKRAADAAVALHHGPLAVAANGAPRPQAESFYERNTRLKRQRFLEMVGRAPPSQAATVAPAPADVVDVRAREVLP